MLLAGGLLVASGCDSDNVDRLRQELDAARTQVTEAQEAARRSEQLRKSTAEQLDQMREQLEQLDRQGEGLVVSIPLVGRLTWDCNDARRFAFTFTPEQATITVEQSIGGDTKRKQLDPGEELTSEFLPPEVHREWTATYAHEPGTISAAISVVPSVKRGMCFIRNSTLEQNRQPN